MHPTDFSWAYLLCSGFQIDVQPQRMFGMQRPFQLAENLFRSYHTISHEDLNSWRDDWSAKGLSLRAIKSLI